MPRLSDLNFHGTGLSRPECVICHASGLIFAADWTGNGGITVTFEDGVIDRILARDAPRPMRPNGFALEPGGTFLLADLGTEEGGIWRLDAQGSVTPVLTSLDGRPLPPSNFVHRDKQGRLWVTISTYQVPRDRAYRADVSDGCIISIIDGKAQLAADGLGYTNECIVAPDGEHLYVNETFARRTSRFPILADGSLGTKEIVATYGAGTFPDGLCFDAEGGFWITSIISNRIIRVDSQGRQTIMLEDSDAKHLAWVEDAFQAGQLGRPHLDRIESKLLRNVSSLAFGGKDLCTAYLGCLLGDAIASFASPVAGEPPSHWDIELGPLARYLT